MKISFHSTVLWTDSTIVLAWIQKDPSVLKPFVRNRVSAIQNLTEINAWKHVPSKENPADIISRGIDPEKIQDCNLWWFGPSFLQDHSVVSPCVCSDINDNELYQREFKKTPTDPVCLVVQGQEVLPIIRLARRPGLTGTVPVFRQNLGVPTGLLHVPVKIKFDYR
ncbi:hypothetical protein AVEN_105031-1 [Araneus ventricosus]|uniref:Uncharacterized protein n=1 Tax=Araneus ventricosus TaxID=182803 RepID=A0A4Y2MZT3_ARAVE|nr:hypothetical protein AVEN_105031-1 [Araneus ventricosus]